MCCHARVPLASKQQERSGVMLARGWGRSCPPTMGFACGAGGHPWLLAQAGMWAWFPDLLQVSEAIFVSSLQMGNLG